MEDRLQKILAHAGIASRRKCEELIVSGRVTVDGVVVSELGAKANSESQRIAVDGKPISTEDKLCLVLHKPTSYVTTVSDPEGRRTVMDLIHSIPQRLYPVGRLDYETSGLLVMSNDGDLTNRLLHPSTHVDKVYRATVIGMPDKAVIAQLQVGVELEDGVTSPAFVSVLRHHPQESVLEITIQEGKNRQVRRMFEHLGFPVKRLKRIQFGPLHLGPLPSGHSRWVTKEEWQRLYASVGLEAPDYPHETRQKAPYGQQKEYSRGGNHRQPSSGKSSTGKSSTGKQRRTHR
jgi:23S rRNA pseudouridine2605 synthase